MFTEFVRAYLWGCIQALPADRWHAIDIDVRQGACMVLQPERY